MVGSVQVWVLWPWIDGLHRLKSTALCCLPFLPPSSYYPLCPNSLPPSLLYFPSTLSSSLTLLLIQILPTTGSHLWMQLCLHTSVLSCSNLFPATTHSVSIWRHMRTCWDTVGWSEGTTSLNFLKVCRGNTRTELATCCSRSCKCTYIRQCEATPWQLLWYARATIVLLIHEDSQRQWNLSNQTGYL